MIIEVSRLAKSFNQHRIFQNLTYTFETGNSYALLGPNGSGKSTLLKIISGFMLPSAGTIQYNLNEQVIEPDLWYKYLDLASPYVELPEELTLMEFLKFHYSFKPIATGNDWNSIINKCGLSGKNNTLIKNFSSGMKQRLKLAIALYSRQTVLLLDEPASNLDQSGIDWYLSEIRGILPEKLVIIASNNSIEHDFCQNRLNLNDYK